MRIGLYGYGKMGKVIEDRAIARGHEICMRVGSDSAGEIPVGIDAAIEFSTPQTIVENIELLLKHDIPIIVGTTGWYDKLYHVKDLIAEHEGAVLYASNFSIGVNLFFRLNKQLAGLMDSQRQYDAALVEAHHVHKLDAPSGTALTLARDLILQHGGYSEYSMENIGEGVLPIESMREGEIPGTHRISWTSSEDEITIEHKAFGRTGFAEGAVVAAEWLTKPAADGTRKSGLYTFDDVLNTI
jgi:4-hydroxy-tetrahydrodipicolinate reductase